MKAKAIKLFCLFFCFAVFAVQQNDFTNVLVLAKLSSCSEFATDILNQKSIIKNQKFPQPFPWRFEITNGYKEGFFYFALLGYAAEMSGDTVSAYQNYRNSTLYINEEKSFGFPEPAAEVYLAIGRTCLEAGRYMDAKDWFDSAYAYANNSPNILAAIGRIVIQRGNEIGDYEDIIAGYQHLEQVSRTSKCEQLTKPEIANYVQVLFCSHEDRKGFSKLLEGISNLGIKNNQDGIDQLVVIFLNNILRADEDDIRYFYDLLGSGIEESSAKAGDEKSLAFLCFARASLCKTYDFLEPENDLKKVKKRINLVKKQFAEGYEPGSDARSPLPVKKKKIIKSQSYKISTTGEPEKTPEIELENLLMQADLYRRNSKDKLAYEYYIRSQNMVTNSIFSNSYDHASMEFAVQSGIAFLSHPLIYVRYSYSPPIENPEAEIKKVFGFPFDTSLRHFKAYGNFPVFAIDYLDVTINDFNELPMALPSVRSFLNTLIWRHNKKGDYQSAIDACGNLETRTGFLSPRNYTRWASNYIKLGKTTKAFDIYFKGLIHYPDNKKMFVSCSEKIKWMDKTRFDYYNKIARDLEMVFAIKATYNRKFWKWSGYWKNFQQQLKSQIKND